MPDGSRNRAAQNSQAVASFFNISASEDAWDALGEECRGLVGVVPGGRCGFLEVGWMFGHLCVNSYLARRQVDESRFSCRPLF